MAHAQKCFDEYRKFYNEKRPHSALDLEVPKSCYRPSDRKMPERIEDWEYGSEYQLCKVKDSGYFNYGGQGYFLSEAFRGKTIAIRDRSPWSSGNSGSPELTWTKGHTP